MRHVALLFVCLLPWCAQGQNVTNVQHDKENGWYIMRIDGVVHLALPGTQVSQLTAERKQLNAQLARSDELIERMRAELKAGAELSKDYDRLRKEYEALTERYRTLTADSVSLNDKYSQLGRDLVDVNKQYQKAVQEYDALTEKYRKVALTSAPRQKMDVGLGMVH